MPNLALVQFRPTKGNIGANLHRLETIFRQLDTLAPRPDVLLLPEAALTGYFLEGGVRELAMPAGELFQQLQETYLRACGAAAPALDIALGFYERHRDRYFNSAMYATLGGNTGQEGDGEIAPGICYVHRKVFLPTYGVFDEARFLEPGHHVAAFDTRFGRVALLICEDAWHSLTGTIAAVDGAQIVYIVSASPARGIQGAVPTNVEHWEMLLRNIASEHGMYAAISQLTGFEGGKAFPGSSQVVGPRGEMLVRGPLWEEALVQVELDWRDLHLIRADLPLLADAETVLPFLLRDLEAAGRERSLQNRWETPSAVPARAPSAKQTPVHLPDTTLMTLPREHTNGAQSEKPLVVVKQPEFDPHSDAPLHVHGEAAVTWLTMFLREEVIERRGFRKVVLGLSGGVDSALVAYLCARAFGPENVVGLRMPYRSSSRESLTHAQLVADDLRIRCETIEITGAVDGYLQLEPEADSRRRGNVMARQRMIVLFDQAVKYDAIPIGTGNKTERLFGYFTWHADDSPPVNPLGDLYKTQVWQLATHMGVPQAIVGKPPSADLIQGQTDEGDFGVSYQQADRILFYLLQGYTAERLVERGFPAPEVEIVVKRVGSTHWKRHLPSVAMVSSTAIGEYYLRPVDY
ncbi:MAG: NAD synthetase [uncultured Chloroflexia bacterium]|uniref:Glutamine-dependent NAD(+) synthetase n=1 Tax=uncultured Chloroflexia bacterium TaxID=1672391 RepID=A0A6J4IVX3_9CHLR|nr:MAG: NAD synthetase [uncultured Chloroflexia bacterium]